LLSEFVGNENAVQSLKQLLKKKEDFPSAILLQGPSGCGKTTLARIIKTELGCEDADFTELNTADFRGIETARDVRTASTFRSFTGGIKVFLFDEAHKLTNDAQNSLLKLLEDTPKNVYFLICTTEPEKLIKTIRTRCITLQVNLLQSFVLVRLLERICKAEGKEVSQGVLKEVAKVSEGSPRQALNLLEQVIDFDSQKAMSVLAEIVVGEAKVIDVCRLLIQPGPNKWSEMSKLISNLEDADPEQIRAAILGYLSKVLLSKGEERIGKMMDVLVLPFYNLGKPLLVMSLWKCCRL
jgi:DNA polymerase-3 subunit gamma/tau